MLRCGTILKKGVDTWNAWRRENPDIRPDLSGAGSARAQLARIIHGGVDFLEVSGD